MKLRWGAIAGQVVTILGVDRLMHIPLPLTPLFAIIAVELASNLVSQILVRRGVPVADWWAGAFMTLDTLLLTGLLYFSGGAFNPFSFLYLVQIALAAVILRERWTWMLVALSLVGSGFLFVSSHELSLEGLPHGDHMRVHLRGMWVAFGVAAGFIVYFLMRVRRALAVRENDLAGARNLAARQEKLASLATLAAGAAHELSTPLSTIALAAKELERLLATQPQTAAIDDVQLIRSQVDRCRAILERMAADAGESAGESPVEVDVADLLAASQEGLRAKPRVEVELDGAQETPSLHVPRRAVAQAIRSLLRNAQDASPEGSRVLVRARRAAQQLRIEIVDTGAGMTPTVLQRAGEPFFTTKAPGSGMGLGLFLTRTIVERIGGELRLEPTPGGGITASLILPVLPPAKILRMGEGA